MPLTVAVIAPGAMGSAVARRLTESDARVVTVLEGRGPGSARRAQDAGMEPVEWAGLARVDMILSIVPPASAMGLAQRLAPVLATAAVKPLYADCNAINPDTVKAVAAVVAAAGAPFADAGIVGGPPPAGGGYSPVFYASGEGAQALARLNAHGLTVRPIDGGVGAASALKMCYAGLTKGMTAVTAAVMLAAVRAGVDEVFHAELADSQAQALRRAERAIPDMAPKAYRWVAEMEEIAGFLGEPAEELFHGAARLYEFLAADQAGERVAVGAMLDFLARPAPR
jgi:putative dehydrogenase